MYFGCLPMSSEEKKISLVVQCHYLPSLKLWHGREERLKEATNSMSEACDKAVQHKFGVMTCRSCMTLSNASRSAGRKRAKKTDVQKLLS